MQRAAAFQLGMTPVCRKLGFGVLEISIAAGTGADLMAGSAGAAGAAPDVLHQPQDYPGFIAHCAQQLTWASCQSRALGLGVPLCVGNQYSCGYWCGHDGRRLLRGGARS